MKRLLSAFLITLSITAQAGLPPLPSQFGNSGKYLTTNGVKSSWAINGSGDLMADGSVPLTGALYPGVTRSISLGAYDYKFNSIHVDTLYGYNSSFPSGGGPSTMSLVSGLLNSNDGITALNWKNRVLIASTGQTSVDWSNRILYSSGVVSAFDWSGTFNDNKNRLLSNVLDPVNLQDSATKNYTDTLSNATNDALFKMQINTLVRDAPTTSANIMDISEDSINENLAAVYNTNSLSAVPFITMNINNSTGGWSGCATPPTGTYIKLALSSSTSAVGITSAGGFFYGSNLCATYTIGSLPSGTYSGLVFASGKWVAVGTNVVAYSTNGTTWVAGTIPAGTYRDIQFLNGQFIAAGTNIISTSSDGISWTSVYTGTIDIYGMSYGNSNYLFTGVNQYLKSSNLSSFSLSSYPFGMITGLTAFGNGYFVVQNKEHSTSSYGLASKDLITWFKIKRGYSTVTLNTLKFIRGIFFYGYNSGHLYRSMKLDY